MLQFAGFLENSFVDWDGRLSSVLFLPGCNFRCGFCHNPELVNPPKDLELKDEASVLEKIDALSDWIDGVVITGGEPTIHSGLPAFISRLKEKYPVKLDTNGTNPGMLRDLIDKGLLDYIAMDVKSSLGSYSKVAGVEVDISKVKESIMLLKSSKIEYEFRTTLVPGLHDDSELREIAKLISGCRRYVLQGFGPDNCLDPSFSSITPFSPAALEAFKALLISLGIPAVLR